MKDFFKLIVGRWCKLDPKTGNSSCWVFFPH